MIKTVELIVFIGLLIFSFFLGVRYSDRVRENVSWLQDKSDEELELPNLSNESPEAGYDSGPEENQPPMDQIQNEDGGEPEATSPMNQVVEPVAKPESQPNPAPKP